MKWIFIVFAVVSTCAGANQTFTYEDLVSLIQTKNLKSVEDVIPELPEDLRSNYTLMEESRSLQQATPLNPRAILFGKDAQFILAFNGEESELGFQTLECIQFRPTERSFDFRQITFPTAQNGLKDVEFSKRNKSTDGHVSCTSCHGADPRPNWDHYSKWLGAYGSQDDEILPEGTTYANFVQARSVHSRYKWLIQGLKPTDPYLGDYSSVDISYRPNLRFSDLAGSLNSLRAFRIAEEKLNSIQQLGFALAGVGCTFSDKQKASLSKGGTATDLNDVTDVSVLFKNIGLKNNEWSTEIFDDDPSTSGNPWNHQSGYGFLLQNVGTLIVKRLADGGNTILKNGLADIEANLKKSHADKDMEFFLTINKSAPYLDQFTDYFQGNKNAICPELTEVFVNEFLGGHSK